MRYVAMMFVVVGIGCTQAPSIPVNHVVEIKNMKFNPQTLTVHRGDTVTWVNRDIVEHDVTASQGPAWKSGALENGGKWQKVISDSVNYFCSIHVVMTGKIRVN